MLLHAKFHRVEIMYHASMFSNIYLLENLHAPILLQTEGEELELDTDTKKITNYFKNRGIDYYFLPSVSAYWN